ncbi:MAG: RNA 3'-terminal phosphate cyclase [Candidatus Methylomirabilales bacterium]
MLRIDGSYGEGGGQILRTALALGTVLERPVVIERIRARRKVAGLQAQHLVGVKALAEITAAETKGAKIGSTSLRFSPTRITHGEYQWDVGTAGAISLVLQTVLIPLAFSSGPSQISITGGTHVPWSPPFPYIEQVLLPFLERMGLRASLILRRWGYYPKGGGLVEGKIQPSTLHPLTLTRRGQLGEIVGVSAVARLPSHVAERQRDQALSRLRPLGLPCRIELKSVEARNPGTILFLLVQSETGRAGFSSLGEKGKPAERVADEACDQLFTYLQREGVADPHLADQLLLPMVLASGSSSVATTHVTQHLLTNAWVVEQFLPGHVRVEGEIGEPGLVIVEGIDPRTDDRRPITEDRGAN